MKQIKFGTGDDLRFFQTLRSRVDAYFQERNLSMKANTAMVVKTVILIAAYLLPFIALMVFPLPFGVSLLLWLLMGWAMAGVGMSVMHDANHGAYSSNQRVNRILGYSLNAIGGISLNWKVQHNILHHTYTNVTGVDEDIDTKAILRLSPHTPHKHVHHQQWWYAFLFYGIGTIYWALVKDFKQYIEYSRKGLHPQSSGVSIRTWGQIVLLKAIYFFTFLGLPVIAGLPFWEVLIGFIVMHVFCGTILAIVFQMAHVVEETTFPIPDHSGHIEDTWAVHQLRTTMNFACRNKWLSWYVGGLNFQVEHHLFTKICHVHYPAIGPIVRRTAQEFGFPYLEKHTLRAALRSHIRHLKTLGRTPLDEMMG